MALNYVSPTAVLLSYYMIFYLKRLLSEFNGRVETQLLKLAHINEYLTCLGMTDVLNTHQNAMTRL